MSERPVQVIDGHWVIVSFEGRDSIDAGVVIVACDAQRDGRAVKLARNRSAMGEITKHTDGSAISCEDCAMKYVRQILSIVGEEK